MTRFQDIVKTQFLLRTPGRRAVVLKAWMDTDEQVGIVCNGCEVALVQKKNETWP
jgi:hypothetical protein